MTDSISFFVSGCPQPKGSTRAFVVKGHAVTTSSNRNLKQWELRIAHEAQAQAERVGWTFNAEASYDIEAHFYFPVPKSYPKKWWHAHTTKPDLDKLGRALNDALTGILFADDSMVTSLDITKGYVEETSPGVSVRVYRQARRWPR
jgi:crossover junction endodeoxyribonuclease RusA